ncbi:hypothetical protein F2P81_018550 [Scophthalmus maximus]|uniref:DNA-directed DNA polymerase n=1 Tax=Scophthalmus maximus TaxID=52904 RepID=A0A6A4SAN7_SCOMX|nr:hypothetical protein F2P81_018550 [Scophthalmus maximus]
MAMPDCQIVFISEGIAIGRSDGPKVLPMDALFTDGQKLEPGAQSPRSRQVSFGAIGLLAPGTPGALPRSRQTMIKCKYVDSLSFLTMRLADMPKALGFEDAVKGFFPHGFSSENTLNYVGPHPPPQTYGLVRMSGDGKREFEKWYETVRHGTFDFKNEAVHYCQNDVDIVFEACCIFRKGYIGETGVDPFQLRHHRIRLHESVPYKFLSTKHARHPITQQLS